MPRSTSTPSATPRRAHCAARARLATPNALAIATSPALAADFWCRGDRSRTRSDVLTRITDLNFATDSSGLSGIRTITAGAVDLADNESILRSQTPENQFE